MEGKRVKEEKTKFKKFLLIYTIILVLLMAIFLIYVADSLIQYEKNQTENYIQYTIEELKEVCKKGKIENYIDISKIEKSEFEKKETSIEEGINKILEIQNITYKKSKNSIDENKPIYDVYANEKQILEITLNGDKTENRLGLLTYNKWKIEKITNKIENGIYTCNILAPNNYKVYVNEKELTEQQITQKEQNEGLTQISKYIEIPHIVKYEIPKLLKQPEVRILDENGNTVEYKTQENTITVDLKTKKIKDQQEALKEIKNAPNIMKIAEDWSLFLTDDLAGKLHGYYTINKYLIKDSDISKYAYKWATGIDITFISAHQLLKPTFTNQKTENYEIYNENAFSCEMYLEKNMKVNGKTMKDKMHERMYFVYDKTTSEWKLVNMQSITENK